MRLFLHLLKYNIIFNKIRMIFLFILSLCIFGLINYFYDNTQEMGEALIQYSSYVMFIIFTGKMNAKNSMMFDIKQIASFPLTNRQIIFLKSIVDSVQMLPISWVFLIGFYKAYPQYNIGGIFLILFLLLMLANIISFNKRIDFSRMQHSKASFKNSILYLHKYLEMFFQILITIICIGVIFTVFRKNYFMQQYSFVIALVVAIVLTGNGTLKMLIDETRSYFIIKRDSFRIGWKALLVIIPMIAFHQVYKNDEMVDQLLGTNSQLADNIKQNMSKVPSANGQKVFLAIIQSDEKAFMELAKDKKQLPWETEFMGNYLPHIAANSNNIKIMNKILLLKPEEVNRIGKFKKRTPLFSALRYCKLEMAQFLINKGANINHQDIKGNTPMIHAAKTGCHGGVLILKDHGANAELANAKGHNAVHYMTKSSGMRYFFPKISKRNREIASEKKQLLKSE